MLKITFLLLLLMISLDAKTIHIAVASNLSYVIKSLTTAFEKDHPNLNIKVTIGSSGKLAAQIQHGAPYGLFLSADMNFPRSLYKNGIALNEAKVYAKGSLSLFSKKEYNLSKGLTLLKSKDIKHIAIANPKTAPYGKAAFEALKNAKLDNVLKKKFVYGESISQTLSYTLTAADIGIVASSALYSPKMKQFKEGSNWVLLNKTLYSPIEQGMVLLPLSRNTPAYKDFYAFLLTKKANAIFNEYGYSNP